MSNIMKFIQNPDIMDIFFIAEIGINHNGDLKIAKKMIDLAKSAGCDAVKFQKRDIQTVYSAELLKQPRLSPWGTTQLDQKKGLEFDRNEYIEISKYCENLDIEWSASAWDLKSASFVDDFDVPFHKIASAMITNKDFLRKVASFHRPTIISTGMSNYEIIDRAIEIFQEYSTPFMLMHSVSVYPTPEETLNLKAIQKLKEKYGIAVGYSGHESSVSPTIAAAALGARVIERHITLDRSMYGSDQSASIEESGLRFLVGALKKIPLSLGSGEKFLSLGEIEVAKKLRYWESN